jgi:hypothetical protein
MSPRAGHDGALRRSVMSGSHYHIIIAHDDGSVYNPLLLLDLDMLISFRLL